jgi:hypothetical protein
MVKEKTKELLFKQCKKSLTPSKDQTWES